MTTSSFIERYQRLLYSGLLGIVCVVGWACVENSQAQSAGVLANPGFESWSNGMPTGWSQESQVRGRGSVGSDGDAAQGSLSLKLSPNSSNSNSAQPYGVAQEILARDWAGKQIEAAVSLRASGGAKGALYILFRSTGGQVTGSKLIAIEEDSNNFQERQALIDLPSDVGSLIVACITTSRTGSVWFDNVRLGPGGAATATTETPSSSGGGDVVFESSFEQWSDGLPEGWVQESRVADRGQVRRDTSAARSGQSAVRLTPNAKNTNQNEPYGIAHIERAEALRGRSLRIEAQLRRQGSAVPGVLFLIRGEGGRILQSKIISLDSGSGEYVAKSADVAFPNDSRDFIVALVVVGTSGEALFDDVRLVGGGTPTSAGGGQAVNIGRTARMSIDAGSVIREIPQTLYGYNLGWVWYGEGIWNAEADGFNEPVVESLQALSPGVIRYPQGSYADFYHWRDGVGPRAARPVRPHGTDDNRSKLLFGTDEFMELCRRVGAEPMLQVNIVTGTPEEAAAWVRYVNDPNNQERINNGHREPYNVKLWEIGNEQYMKTENPRLKQTEMSPSEYVTKFRQFVAAMKAVDPTIKVGAIGNRDYERYQLGRGDDWNERVLGAIGKDIDFFAVHNSYAPAFASQSGATMKDIYAALAAFPEQVEDNLAAISEEIRNHAGSHADDVQIAITEWGPLFHILPSDPYVDHPKTLGSALFVAMAMQKYIGSPMTGMTNFFKATEHAFMAAVGNNGATKPSGYVIGMYANNFGKRLVTSSVESSTFATRAVGNVAAVPAAPYVSAIASLSQDASKLYVMAVNKDFDGSRPLQIHVDGFEPASGAKIVTLTGPALDAHNGDDLPEVPGIVWAPQARAPNSAWEQGKPGFVSPKATSISGVSSDFTVDLPPMSVVSIELTRR